MRRAWFVTSYCPCGVLFPSQRPHFWVVAAKFKMAGFLMSNFLRVFANCDLLHFCNFLSRHKNGRCGHFCLRYTKHHLTISPFSLCRVDFSPCYCCFHDKNSRSYLGDEAGVVLSSQQKGQKLGPSFKLKDLGLPRQPRELRLALKSLVLLQ